MYIHNQTSIFDYMFIYIYTYIMYIHPRQLSSMHWCTCHLTPLEIYVFRAARIDLAGAAVGIGNFLSSWIHSVAQNPSLAKQSFGFIILGFALAKVIACV